MTRLHRPTRAMPRQQNGVGLIEVLVAVLVVSIGFLGVAALQVYALSTNNGAMARSMATVTSYSILDAMRADSTGLDASSYNTTVTANNCAAVGSGTFAKNQLTHWCEQLGHDLGASAHTTGNVACAVAPDGKTYNCTVTITFDDSHAADAGVNAAHLPAGASSTTVVTEARI